MHIVATVIEATHLFIFAEQEEIATYNGIQDLIYKGDADHQRRHHHWFLRSCFIVGRDEFDEYWQDDRIDWLPEVELMVRKYMKIHDIENLVIVTGKDAYLVRPLTLDKRHV